MRQIFTAFLALITLIVFAAPRAAVAVEVDVSLRGSPNSMVRQNQMAKKLGYDFIERPEDVHELVDEGVLVRLPGNEHYVIHDGVSYPYARPEVRLFVERLAQQYHQGTGEVLVVTSLTRPMSAQPRNSHDLSVHPTGIAIDLRVSSKRLSRAWLESVLLKLERTGLLDITRERYPPHYHIALFPEAYRNHVVGMIGEEAVAKAMDYNEPDEEAPSQVAVAVDSTAAVPVMTASAAVHVVDSNKNSKMLLYAALPLAALIFFALGYWRGAKTEEDA